MLIEIEHAAGWWASQLSKTTPQETQAFKQALMVELSARYAGHWFSDDAQRGCAYRCISYDHRLDSTLLRAAQTAQIDQHIETLLIKARWHSMFVNPGLVKVQNTNNIAASPIVVYPQETSTTTTTTTTAQPQQLTVPGFTPRRSSMNDVPRTHTRNVSFASSVMVSVTPVVDVETPVSALVTVNGLAPSLMPNAPLGPKKSALKGHQRSKSTSPVSVPLSVRFTPFNPQAATFVSTSPPQDVIKPASPPTTTLAPPKPASPTLQLAKPASPPSIPTPASPPTMGSTSRDTSPKAVHHGSHSVDLNSALFANLTLNVKPSARTVPVPPTMTLTVTPPGALAPTPAPAPAPAQIPAPLDDRATPLPTIFTHMTRMNKPTHHVSRSMCSFPYNWNLNLSNVNNTSPTSSPSSPTQLSPTSLSLPRMVSHHRGLSASLLPSALLVV